MSIFENLKFSLSSPEMINSAYFLSLVYLGILWVALIAWVTRDVLARSKNFLFQAISVLLVLTLNIFGLVIYLLVRPRKTLNEKLFERLELQAFMEELQKNRERGNIKAPEKKQKTPAKK